MSNQGIVSPWVELALTLAGEAVNRVQKLSQKSGAEVVETRDSSTGSYRYWDTETLRIDKEIEEFYIDQLAENGIDAIVLSEEVGSYKVEPKTAPEISLDRPVFFVSDPFDGSLLYKRNIPAFWFSALAVYTRPEKVEIAEPLTAAVIDLSSRMIYYCDIDQSYEGVLDPRGKVEKKKVIKPGNAENLADAFLETYLMKPHYLYPTAEQFKFLFNKVKFILPNGGPCGFCDVASGRIDIYFGFKQPHTDIYPGLAIAEKAGCVVSTFEGAPVKFDDRVEKRYNVICTANQAIHDKVLNLLADNGIKDTAGLEED
mgnify:CR=1 FL=1